MCCGSPLFGTSGGIERRIFVGYDVSFHPISPEEMREWYFTPLTWIQQGQEEKVLALAAQHGMEDFYAEKYLNTLRVGVETEADELFDKSHGFYIAVIQGFFRDYYYTRGSAFSFLVEQKPEYARYFTSWEQITPVSFPNPMQNRIIENYCSGVYLSPDQWRQWLHPSESPLISSIMLLQYTEVDADPPNNCFHVLLQAYPIQQELLRSQFAYLLDPELTRWIHLNTH